MRQVKSIFRESLTLALWIALVFASWQTALAADSMPEQSSSLLKWVHFSIYALGGFFLFAAVGHLLASIAALVLALFRKKFSPASAQRFLLAVFIGTGILVMLPLLMPGPIRPLVATGASVMKLFTGIASLVIISYLTGTIISVGFLGLMDQLSARAQWSLLWGFWLFLIVVAPLVVLIGNLHGNGSSVSAIAGIVLTTAIAGLLTVLFVPKFYDWMQKGGTGRWTIGAVVLVLIFIITTPLPRKIIHGSPADENSPPVILVSIDTLRADALSCYSTEGISLGTPNMDRVAEEGALFENAYSAAPWTLPGVASFLTGLPPQAHGALDYKLFDMAPGATALAEIFGQGYVTAGFTVNPILCPGHGIDQGFDYYVEEDSALSFGRKLLFERIVGRIILTWPDPQTPNYNPVLERDAVRGACDFVRKHNGEKYFLWLHLCAPHVIYFPPKEYRERIRNEFGIDFTRGEILRQPQLDNGGTPVTQESLRTIQALYAGEVTFSDDLVGELISELESLGVYDECIFAITSDHGEEFYDHDRITHGHSLHRELLQVPLIIRYPTAISPGLRITNSVSTIDLPPTLLDLAGVEPSLAGNPAEFMGRSLVPAFEGSSFQDMPVFFEAPLYFDRHIKGLIFGDYFYIGGDGAVLHPRLFNLSDDPDTYYDILRDQPEMAEYLSRLLREHSDLAASIASRIGAGASSDNLETFRAVGYLN